MATSISDIFAERGDEWLKALPVLIDERCAAWDLQITGEAFSGGTHSYVAPVRRADGTSAVLKLPVVDAENLAEATALHHYDGEGAIRLYAFDRPSGALLLEYALPGEPLVHQPPEGAALEGRPENADRFAIACALFRRLWRPAPETPGFPPLPRVTDLVKTWATGLPEAAKTTLPDHLVARTVELCGELATPDGEEGIVNRDTHLGNIVSAQREPWLLIDPKPLLGERAFDAGFFTFKQVQYRPEAGFAREMVARTADGLGVSPERVRAWAFLRAVGIASAADEGDDPDDTARELATAEALR
ncbi:MAG: aminoglycoside phosphotransferase family protein [Stackebrandtia sp.]